MEFLVLPQSGLNTLGSCTYTCHHNSCECNCMQETCLKDIEICGTKCYTLVCTVKGVDLPFNI